MPGARGKTTEKRSAWRFIDPFYYLSALLRHSKTLPSKAWEGFRWCLHYLGRFILFLLFLAPNLFIFTACLLPAKYEATESWVPEWHQRYSVFWDYMAVYDFIWGMYESITRQGLQYYGVFCGLLFIGLHTEMMVHSLTDQSVKDYHHSVSRDLPAVLEDYAQDKQCAYFAGTGIPLQGYGDEPLAWYAAYHIALCLIAIMLILDEVTNVRVGCLAPQWTRAGNGWTLLYLMSATLSHSANYGPKGLILFRYYLLTIFVLIGAVFNLLRGICASHRWGPANWRREANRCERYALRPWFGKNAPLTVSAGQQNQPYMVDKEKRYKTDKLAHAIGDQARERSRFTVKRSREDIDAHPKQRRFIETFDRKTADQYDHFHGYASKQMWRGWRIQLPLLTPEQRQQKKRNTWGAIPNWAPVFSSDKSKGFQTVGEGMEWKKGIVQYFDFRRYLAVSAGLCMFTVQLFLAVHDLNYMARNNYNQQYDAVSGQWKENGGPSDDQCGYYELSAVPINVLPGSSGWTCIRSSLAWSGIHHTMLMGMSLAVVLVAWTNNRFWGMHFTFLPISLVGPRLSSNSIGITLQLVAYATMSQSMFFTNVSLFWCARFVTYYSLGIGYLYFIVNEPMRNKIIRNPFPGKYWVTIPLMWMDNTRQRMGRGEDEDDDD